MMGSPENKILRYVEEIERQLQVNMEYAKQAPVDLLLMDILQGHIKDSLLSIRAEIKKQDSA